MTCLNRGCLKINADLPSFATSYIVSLLKNMANESKAFRSLFKIAYYELI